MAVLFESYIDPWNLGVRGTDDTVESMMHTINYWGHRYAYTSTFDHDHDDNSLIVAAMDAARGGTFVETPETYPSSAWYHSTTPV